MENLNGRHRLENLVVDWKIILGIRCALNSCSLGQGPVAVSRENVSELSGFKRGEDILLKVAVSY
jgi:hypothetical protein